MSKRKSAAAGNVPRCPLCNRQTSGTQESLVDHLVSDHTARAVAGALLNSVRGCGKKRFPSEGHAKQSLLMNTISMDPHRREMRAYLCATCKGSWHLTSQDQRTGKSQDYDASERTDSDGL